MNKIKVYLATCFVLFVFCIEPVTAQQKTTDQKVDSVLQLMSLEEKIIVSMELTNTGPCEGEEIVQLYLHDLVASVARPVMELRDFQKVKLKAGETKTLRFIIDREKLSFYDQQLNRVVEPGMFELMIGASSRDIRLRDRFELVE